MALPSIWAYNSCQNHIDLELMPIFDISLEEDVMLKSFLLLSAALFIGLAPTQSQRVSGQEATPEAAAPAVSSHAGTANPVVKPTAESQAKAKSLYQIDCAMCHGDNGDGKTDLAKSMGLIMPDYTDPKALAGRQDGDLFDIIRNGKDKMPPEATGRASDTLVWNLIIYIRAMSK